MGRLFAVPYEIKKMDVKLESVIAKMRELQKSADELMEIRSSLIRYKGILADAWISTETEGINDIIDDLNRQAGRLIDELCEIGYDMVKACEEAE